MAHQDLPAGRHQLKSRLRPVAFLVGTILLGLVSRSVDQLPLWIGDVLWGSMTFLLVTVFIPRRSAATRCVIALTFCCLIEVSQLYQASWINEVRSTTIGYLVLGNGFAWSDLVLYSVGVGCAVVTDRLSARGRPAASD